MMMARNRDSAIDGAADCKRFSVHLTRVEGGFSVAIALLAYILCGCDANHSESEPLPSYWTAIPPETISIPKGVAWLGCRFGIDGDTAPCDPWGYPQVEVTFPYAYDITTYEVTVGQYRRCVAEGVCASASPKACGLWVQPDLSLTPMPVTMNNFAQDGRDGHPANCITRAMAATFCGWLGAGWRLPNEPEWLRAVHGGCEFHPDGKCRDSMAWLPIPIPASPGKPVCAVAAVPNGNCGDVSRDENSCGLVTSPVGTFGMDRSPYGLMDVIGNVSEFVRGAGLRRRKGNVDEVSLKRWLDKTWPPIYASLAVGSWPGLEGAHAKEGSHVGLSFVEAPFKCDGDGNATLDAEIVARSWKASAISPALGFRCVRTAN